MLETNLPSTSQDFTITSEHAPNPAQEREQHQILLTLLRPAMLRVDELVTIQSESMRMQREMMGVILSLTLRLDAMATTRSQSVDDRRPELDQIDRNGKKSMNEEENEHRQRCHCGINDTLKESISRGVAEAKAALLTSINALSDRLDASSTDIGKLLKLHSPPSSTLSQHKLDSQVVATDSSPTSRKRRRVDFEREDIMMDGTDQNPPLHMLSQSNATLDDKSKRTVIELQTKKHSIENEELTDAGTGVTGETERFRGSFPEPERHLAEPSSSTTTEKENSLRSNVNDTSTKAGPAIEADSSLSSSVNSIAVFNSNPTTVNHETEYRSTNAGSGRVFNPINLTTCDASSQSTTNMMIQQLPTTSEDLQHHRSGFLRDIATLMEKKGTPLPPSLTGIQAANYNLMDSVWIIEPSEKVGFLKLAGKDIDLFLLWAIVVGNGGAKAVTSSDSWASILPHFNLPERFPDAQEHGSTSVAFALSKYDCSILYPFELLYQRNLQAQQSRAQPET